MARARHAPASYRYGKSLKVKDCIMGKISGTPTPLGRKRIQLQPDARGKRICAHGCNACDAASDTCCEDESSCSPEEKCSMTPCFPCGLPYNCMTRGQQGLEGWWRKTSSAKVLGPLKECMQSLAQHCLISARDPDSTTLQVLSLSDGNMNDSECVPTSVLLAHAFASLGIDELPDGLERIRIFGADVQNPSVQTSDPEITSGMPPWLELKHVCLDNSKHFKPQLWKCGLRPHELKFDVVLMRQGLCYCQDHSFDVRPPKELKVSGIQEGTSHGPSGIYVLEQFFRNGRPSYRNGRFLLHWRPDTYDWVVVEDSERGYVYANVCKNSGSPALAQAAWYAWNGKDFVIDERVSCEVTALPPWKRPPRDCKCCAGISLDAAAQQSFMGRAAAVLDQNNPGAFALLHGGYYKGVADEIEEFYAEVEIAAERFNSNSPYICANILRRQESQDTESDPAGYWNQILGLRLSVRLT